MRQLVRRLHYLLNRRRFDDELAEEMEAHREMAAGNEGVAFGNALRLREEARDAWGWTWIDRLGQDLRYAARRLRNSPGFTATAVLMLAFGVGVNTTAFGYFNLLVLRPLPVRDPDTLRRFSRSAPGNFADNMPYAAVAFYREHSRTLSAVLASTWSKVTVEGADKPLSAGFVTANFFTELGGTAGLGRVFDPVEHEGLVADPVVVLDQGLWQRHFGANPSVVGTTILLNGKSATVIGVASRDFSGLSLGRPDLWVPLGQRPYFFGGEPLTRFGEGGLSVFMWARLQPGITPQAAEDELKTLAAELHRQHPQDVWEGESLPSQPAGYATRIVPPMYPALALVAALCLLILVVACGNLGSLLLARGVAREQEMSIRAAIGAGRGRLVRQLFTESLLLALLGSAVGVAAGYVALRSLMVWTAVPEWLDPAPDGRVITFAAGIALASAVLFGLTPALHVSRQRHRGPFARRVLIGGQIAASCVLLIVAGLLVRALNRATSVAPGFDYRQVVALDPGLWSHSYTPERARAYLARLRDLLHELPGVEAVSIATNPPLGNRWSVRKAVVGSRTVGIHVNGVDPAFFQVMGIPLLRGRTLERGETAAIVVSESLARLEWPAEDALGKSFRMGTSPTGADVSATVVGVVGSARLVSPEDSDAVEVYGLAEPSIFPSVVVLVRTRADAHGMLRSVAQVAKSIDPDLFPEVQALEDSYRQKVQTSEYAALAASLLGLVALVIACVGIVGLVAFSVSRRTREIGIRLALGAPPAHVVSVVLRQLARPVAVGLLVGVGGAAALCQVLRGVLYGVSHLDPVAYVTAVVVFLVAVAVAALWPARRALRVDPCSALRYE